MSGTRRDARGTLFTELFYSRNKRQNGPLIRGRHPSHTLCIPTRPSAASRPGCQSAKFAFMKIISGGTRRLCSERFVLTKSRLRLRAFEVVWLRSVPPLVGRVCAGRCETFSSWAIHEGVTKLLCWLTRTSGNDGLLVSTTSISIQKGFRVL